ncbi:hypothetical protein C4J65_26585 [Streptomyces sp. CB09001]|nr:hypothetical protein C4J65_26585 [Streptomyces sp. CB09001]
MRGVPAEPGATAREQTRRRVVDAAMDLLERGGRDAVAERGFTRFLAAKEQLESAQCAKPW